ncbi:peptide-methionine (S)-S-oxide reductase MsrA [Caenimonas terrae]|uniref:Peptide methionine sulfoxide reductase MsrA n=1 Tax=Caenimonas terrae TaxID=696074 RepID=A0ABW0NDD5_9BURK
MPTRRNTILALGSGATLLAGWAALAGGSPQQAVALPPPAFDPPNPAARDSAVLAGGCFWGVQAVYQHTRGVLNAVSGYAGGDPKRADYGSVSSGSTGHAESVEVSFDPGQLSYGRLLQIFFSVVHDPTQRDRQGPDTGTQYRSVVFFRSPAQKEVAARYIAQLDAAKVLAAKIVTQLVPLPAFFPAEAYHQDYATRNPGSPYIARFDAPKVANLQRLFASQYRESPVLVSAQRTA